MTPLFNSLPPFQKRLLLLLQNSLWGNPVDEVVFEGINPGDWKKIMQLAASQGVFALALDGLTGLPLTIRPPRSLLIEWALGAKKIENRYNHQINALRSLTRLYSENGIKCLLIKGLGISRLYHVPEHRESGDLDLFLFGDFEKGNRLVEEKGIEVQMLGEVHSNFNFELIPVENHRTFLQIKKQQSDRDLELLLHAYLTQDPPLYSEQFGAYVPPLSFNLLFLFKHAVKHFLTEGIVLRHLCDWALVLHQCKDHKDYQAFYDSIRPYNMHRYADAFLDIAVDCLGLPENKNFVTEPDPLFSSKVLSDILHKKRNEENPSRRNLWQIISGKVKGALFLHNSRWKYDAINRKVYRQEWGYRLRHYINIFRKR